MAVRTKMGRLPLSCSKQRNSVELRGKSGKSLSRYFPEMWKPLPF